MPAETDIDKLPPGFADEEGPVFAEPWEAHAFALTLALHQQGRFEWQEWSAQLAQVIADSAEAPDRGYYQHWMQALERLAQQKGLADPVELDRRTEQWRRAYLATPHGQPVMLNNGIGEQEG